MKSWVLAAGVALSVFAATPALAAAADFALCDGYPAPSKKADGMTQGSGFFGLATTTQDVRRSQFQFGAEQAKNCDAALSDVLLQPKFWLRRGHLLQAKAMHQLEAGDAEGAILSLAASDAIGAEKQDLFFMRSVTLGNSVLRALALFKLGKREAALAELDAVDRARPYATDITRLTRAVRLDNMDDLAAQRALLMAGAPMNPSLLGQLFWISMFYNDFAQVLALAPQVSFDVPKGRGDWQIEGSSTRKYELIERRAEFAGATAYAYAATGKPEAAKAVMAEARADVEEAIQPPAPPKPGGKLKRHVVADYEMRKAGGQKATRALDQWDAAISLMERAPGMTLDEVAKAARDARLRDNPAMLHILGRVKPTTQTDIAAQRDVMAAMEKRRNRELDSIWKVSFRDLVKMLPRPEREKMQPYMKPAGDGLWFSDSDGSYIKRERTTPYINVRFGSDIASKATVEEMGLLAAALESRRLGKDSFLIDSRMIIERTVNVYMQYGGMVSSYPNGNETRLRILPVNASELPASLEHSRWRLIRVADVVDALYARYRPPSTRPRRGPGE